MGTQTTFQKTEQKEQDQDLMDTFGEPQTDHSEMNAWHGEHGSRSAEVPKGEVETSCLRATGTGQGSQEQVWGTVGHAAPEHEDGKVEEKT